MYNLHLSPEQLEIRDTVRDFVTREIKPAALKADRLDVADRSLLMAQIDAASQLGLRTLELSEERGGAGADALTSCIVTEELAAGDADIAAVLSETSRLSHLLFDLALNDAQREQFLPKLTGDDRYHLAFAAREPETDACLGVNYHRPTVEPTLRTTAVKSGSDFVINGVKDCVANAPLAGLFAVLTNIPGHNEPGVLLVPAKTPGVSVKVHEDAWHHGSCGTVTFKDCKVSSLKVTVPQEPWCQASSCTFTLTPGVFAGTSNTPGSLRPGILVSTANRPASGALATQSFTPLMTKSLPLLTAVVRSVGSTVGL